MWELQWGFRRETIAYRLFTRPFLISESWIYWIVVRWNTEGSGLWDRAMDNFFLISDGVLVWVFNFFLFSDGKGREGREREREREC
jgi:hypothetical protein